MLCLTISMYADSNILSSGMKSFETYINLCYQESIFFKRFRKFVKSEKPYPSLTRIEFFEKRTVVGALLHVVR